MNRRNASLSGLKLVTPWLAGLLMALMVVLSVGSGAHRDHADHADQHSCAVCLIAHGNVLADGAIGTTIVASRTCLVLPPIGESLSASIFDLRLAPGRAPPV